MNARALWILSGLFGLPLTAAAVPTPTEAATPVEKVSTDARMATVRRYISMWESGRIDQLGTVIADGYVGHAASEDRDLAGLRQRITAFHLAYPDMRFTIHDQIVQGDRVATRMTAVGTSGKTNKRMRLAGLNISRFAGNRIVEEWPVWEVVSDKP